MNPAFDWHSDAPVTEPRSGPDPKHLVASLPQALFLLAPDLSLASVNPAGEQLAGQGASRLIGRHGQHARTLLRESAPSDLEVVAGTNTPWAELNWALRHEQVRFLDDLLLRRTRLGLLLPDGAGALLPRLEPVAREALGWSAGEWRDQRERYARIIDSSYSVPTP